ncbi:MAG: hypothetical protein KF871_03315 [Hydrogenophaga sp.]|uniref:hypothetical protein n=1 Tax=Hydrogenophaga sp. TaxID=1904254 RepID=UPI001DC13C6A|nr:hypothetical protein [Hydrogenophaga sp.]MBX3608900.1 hypothetical protein [Hydrogenophaga sp.]
MFAVTRSRHAPRPFGAGDTALDAESERRDQRRDWQALLLWLAGCLLLPLLMLL